MTDEIIEPTPKTFTEAEVQALIDAKVQTEVQALKAKNDELIGEKRAEAEKKRLAEEEKRLADLELAQKNGDWQSIEADYKRQIQEAIEEKSRMKQEFDSTVNTLTVGTLASDLSSELAKPSLKHYLKGDIEKRLYRDADGNIRVKDKNGVPSAATIEDLKNELRNDPAYQDLIIINNSTGGGATGGGFGGGAGKEADQYTEAEKIKLFKENRTEYNRIFK